MGFIFPVLLQLAAFEQIGRVGTEIKAKCGCENGGVHDKGNAPVVAQANQGGAFVLRL